jgi:chromosome segregation protein
MHLKRLELLGFKTFAEPTELHLDQGITCVVGPNGSGKSNISDSILWVLGEQSFKSLRASRSEDVIFAGSPARKPIGLAEVSLTLDNSGSLLPLDFSEVTITRRIFRTGDSEFYINRVPCRLRDIHELLLDSGIGKDSYSLISQTEVDAVLSARSEDRRDLVEQAAGIQKYRHRKRETQRKLENTRANLLRLNDIIGELESQVHPLARQCEAARRYQELSGELTQLKLGLLLNQHQALAASLARSREREAELDQEIEQTRTRLHQLAAGEAELRAKLQKTEQDLEERRSLVARLVREADRAQGRLALDQERRAALENQQELLSSEVAATGPRLEAARAELARAQQQHEELAARQESLAAEVARKEQALAAAFASFETMSDDQEKHRASYLDSLSRSAEARNALTQCQSLLRAAQARLGRLTDNIAVAQQELDAGRRLAASREADLSRARERRLETEARLHALRSQREEADQGLSELRERAGATAEDLARTQSRLKALRELETAREGYPAGVKAVFAAASKGALEGAFHTVADLVDAPAHLRLALELALGPALDYVVCETEEQARQAISYLKVNNAGRATFLPLDRIRRRPAQPQPPAPPQGASCLGPAVALVSFEERFRPIFDHLLGRVLVARDLETALRLPTEGWRAIVSLEGDLLRPWGALAGGSPRAGSSILSWRHEIEELDRSLSRLQAQLADQEQDQREVGARLQDLEQQIAAAEVELDSRDKEAAAAERALDVANTQLSHQEEQSGALKAEREALSAEAAEDERESQQLSADLQTVEQEKASLEEAMRAAEHSVKSRDTERMNLASALSELRVALAAAQGELRSAETQAESSQRLIGDLESDRERKQAQLARLQEEAGQALLRIQQAEEAARDLGLARDRGEEELEAARQRRQQLLEAVSANLAEAEAARAQGEDLQARLHRSQLRTTQLASELGFLEQKLNEDHRLTLEQAQRLHQPVENRTAAQERIQTLEEEITALGPVNLAAAEEYERVNQRLQFLSSQRADLEKARDDLMQVIAQIDREATSSFLDTFDALKREFQDLFSRLFGGGEAELLITNPEDVLESGIDINVTIPGKHHRSLLALSGGERALTAAAFLFALLRVKPSPFVVLDEIDAPLDDSNIDRYRDLLKEFSRKSQFIIITHNKGTMEAADTIYGVTMETPGVSKLLSMRLTDAQAVVEEEEEPGDAAAPDPA